jgi:hypothetical protein
MGHRMIEIGMRIRWPRDETVDIMFAQGLDIDLDVQAPFEGFVQLDVTAQAPEPDTRDHKQKTRAVDEGS